MSATDDARSRQQIRLGDGDYILLSHPHVQVPKKRELHQPENGSIMLNRNVGHTYRPILCDNPEELTITKSCIIV